MLNTVLLLFGLSRRTGRKLQASDILTKFDRENNLRIEEKNKSKREGKRNSA